MAHKKAGGSTALGRDSQSKRLGVKLSDGQHAKPGAIIIRQRGTKYHAGTDVLRGNDDTLYSAKHGFVKFTTKKLIKFDGSLKETKIVNVLPSKTVDGKVFTTIPPRAKKVVNKTSKKMKALAK